MCLVPLVFVISKIVKRSNEFFGIASDEAFNFDFLKRNFVELLY